MSETTTVSVPSVKSALVRKGLIAVGAVAGLILVGTVLAKIKSSDIEDITETSNV